MRSNFRLLITASFFIVLLLGIFNLSQLSRLNRQVQDLEGNAVSSESGYLRGNGSNTPGVPNVGGDVNQSQDDLVTTAVEKAAPSVVSIVISKDVPNLDVTYVNPFENDPLFKNLNFKIPVYRNMGSHHQRVGSGSGFIISHSGHVVTNKHVVSDENAKYTVLLSDGSQKKAEVLYRDSQNDLAVLKIEGTFPNVVSIGDSSEAKLGQTVVAIGNALGEYENSVSVGIISGMNRTVEAYDISGSNKEELKGVFQTDASINLGNSGGPLIDLSGNVIGINVATIYGSNNISFAIPIDMLKPALNRYIQR